MKKDEIYEILKREHNPANIFRIEWDRGNGPIERRVFFEGFDSTNKPLLQLEDSKDYLDIDQIGGYSSVKSLSLLCTDNPNAEYE